MADTVQYSKEDPLRVRNLFSIQIFFMKAFGQVIPRFQDKFPQEWQTIGILLSYGFCFLTSFLTTHVALLFVVSASHSFEHGQLEDITDALTMLIIYMFASFSSIYWIFNSEKLDIFFKSINKEYIHHSLPGLTFVSAYRSYKVAKVVTIYWILACICGVVFWALSPLFLHQRDLPVKCWYPFDTKIYYIYEIVYFVQFLAQCEMGAAFGNGSAIYVSTIIIMLGQFDVLFCSLKNSQAHSELLAGVDINIIRKKQQNMCLKGEEVNQYVICKEHKIDMDIYNSKNKRFSSTKQLQSAMRQSMKLCIMHHQFILRSCAKLEELFSPYCLIKSLQITMQLCLLVFIAVVGDRSLIRSINLVGYLALTCVELFMFTYFGELLKSHSLRAGDALLRSPWHKNTSLIKKDLLIFLINTKKPVQLTAGKFFIMNVERLRSVVTQAFSFLTLLQKLAAKKP